MTNPKGRLRGRLGRLGKKTSVAKNNLRVQKATVRVFLSVQLTSRLLRRPVIDRKTNSHLRFRDFIGTRFANKGGINDHVA